MAFFHFTNILDIAAIIDVIEKRNQIAKFKSNCFCYYNTVSPTFIDFVLKVFRANNSGDQFAVADLRYE